MNPEIGAAFTVGRFALRDGEVIGEHLVCPAREASGASVWSSEAAEAARFDFATARRWAHELRGVVLRNEAVVSEAKRARHQAMLAAQHLD